MKNENKQTYYNQCELKYKINEKYNQMQILQIKENNRIEEVNEIKDVKLLFIKPYCVPPEKANPRIKKPAVFFNIFLIDKNNKRIVVTTYPNKWTNTILAIFLNEKFDINKFFTIEKTRVWETWWDKLAIKQDGKEIPWAYKKDGIIKLNKEYNNLKELTTDQECFNGEFIKYKIKWVDNWASFLLYDQLLNKKWVKNIWDINKEKYFIIDKEIFKKKK